MSSGAAGVVELGARPGISDELGPPQSGVPATAGVLSANGAGSVNAGRSVPGAHARVG